MDAIAVIDGRTVIYWNGIVLTLAACVAACFFLSFYLGRGGSVAAGFAAIPTAMVLSLVCARFFHWYSRADSYSGFLDAMTNYRSGGYALTGVFLGCVLTALLLRLIRFHRNTPMMLDCMSMAGAAGIAVGRLASLFNSSDRGQILSSLKSLPFAWPVTNAVSGQTEYRLATFMIQSMVAAGLFAALTVYDRRTRRRRDGDICLRGHIFRRINAIVWSRGLGIKHRIENCVSDFVSNFDAVALNLAGVDLNDGADRIARNDQFFRHWFGIFFDHANGGVWCDKDHI